MNAVTASFNTTVRQMTKIYQQKMTERSQRKKKQSSWHDQCSSRCFEKPKPSLKFSDVLSKCNGTSLHIYHQNTLKPRFAVISRFR